MALDVIKEYLVSLGFNVDNKSLDTANKTVDGFQTNVVKTATKFVSEFSKSALAFSSFIVGANVGIAKFISSLGKADIENEIFARKMWTNQESAMALNYSMKALGANLEDLYLSPTLMNQFIQLRKEAYQLQAPAGYKDELKQIQDIRFEFARLKLEATYSLQWIGYYFMKYMAGPIGEFKTKFHDFNDMLVQTMPHWTKIIAQVMSWFVSLGIAGVKGIKDIGAAISWIADLIPLKIKLIIASLLGINTILAMSPLMRFITLLGVGLLLLQDFYTYKSGGKSALAPLWEDLTKIYDKFKNSGDIKKFKTDIKNAFNEIDSDIAIASNFVIDFLGKFKEPVTLNNFKSSLNDLKSIAKTLGTDGANWVKDFANELKNDKDVQSFIKDLSKLIASITHLLKDVIGSPATQKAIEIFGEALTKIIKGAVDVVDELVKGLTSAIDLMDKIGMGDSTDVNKKLTPPSNYYTSPGDATKDFSKSGIVQSNSRF